MVSFTNRSVTLGVVYWFKVFVVAFALGVVRTFLITPFIGATPAVLLELPIMIYVSYKAATGIMTLRLLDLTEKQAVGATAFLLLLCCEAWLAQSLGGQTSDEWVMSLFSMPGILGLAGQIVFALIPAIVEL